MPKIRSSNIDTTANLQISSELTVSNNATFSGNVGIGTSSPTAGFKLDVNGTAMAGAYCFGQTNRHLFYDVSATEIGIRVGTAGPYYGIGTTGSDTMRINSASGGDMLFAIGTTERMRINTVGNVGIGTSSPGRRLDVRGGDIQVSRAAAGVDGDAALYFGNGGNNYIYGGSSSNLMAFVANGTERMRINTVGNVGIGTSSPTSRLTITGGVTEIRDGNYLMLRPSGNAWDMRLQATGTQLDILSGGALGSPIMSLVNGGNVGIGTSSPGNRLDIVSVGSSQIRVKDGIGASSYYDFGRDGTDGFFGFSGAQTTFSGYKWSVNAGTEVMRIMNGGDVGIGTSSPFGSSLTNYRNGTARYVLGDGSQASDKKYWDILSSSGTLYMRALADADNNSTSFLTAERGGTGTNWIISAVTLNTAGAERMRVDSSGNVGIGTSSPSSSLQVDHSTTSGVGIRVRQLSTTQYAGAGVLCNGPVGSGSQGGTGFYHFNANIGGTQGRAGISQFDENGSFVKGLAEYDYTNNYWAFSTNGTESMRISGDGNIDIGGQRPTAAGSLKYLDVYNLETSSNNSGVDLRLITRNTANTGSVAVNMVKYKSGEFLIINDETSSSALIGFNNAGLRRMTIANDGHIGMGRIPIPSSSAILETNGDIGILLGGAQSLHFNGYYTDTWRYATTGQYSAAIRFDATNGTLQFWNSTSAGNAGAGADVGLRMMIDRLANVTVGTADTNANSGTGVKLRPGQSSSVSIVDSRSDGTSVGYSQYSTGAGAYRFYVAWNGQISATSTTISAISDIRLKENIRDLDYGLDTILALKPRRFDWKSGKGKDTRDDIGFIAQELEPILPELVGDWMAGEGEPDDLKSVKAGDLIPVLVKAIQQLAARVIQLESK